jgi:twitching motility protein PilT
MQQQARFMLAGTLRGVVAQRLVPHVNGSGRVPVVEALVSTGRVRDLIGEPSRAEDLVRIIQEGEYYGMQTFDQSLIQRVNQGLISMDEALQVATNPSDMKLQAQSTVTSVPGV